MQVVFCEIECINRCLALCDSCVEIEKYNEPLIELKSW